MVFLGLVGGLGLFVYGLNKTGKALQQVTSFRFRNQIEKLTKNVFLSTLLGISVTAIVQSSSATTVLLVSFINAGLISLTRCIGVIFGANIGTTLTVQIISLNVEQYTIPAIGIGVFLSMMSRRNSIVTLGKIILGFGLIFLGLSVMKNAVSPLSESDIFKNFISDFSTYSFKGIFLGFLISTVITAIMQASGATLGIVIALASVGVITDIRVAIPLILGSKVGTCITAFLASINSNRDSKRVALGHFIFNLASTAITLAFLGYLVDFVTWTSADISRQIANAHTAISVFTTLLLFPFVKQYVMLIEFIIPIKKDEESRQNFFDLNLLDTPSIAISSVRKALVKMGGITRAMVRISCDGFVNNSLEIMRNISRLEARVDKLQQEISDFIMEISKAELSGYQAFVINSYREITDDFERIGDHVEGMVESIVRAKHESCCFTSSNIFLIKNLRDSLVEQFNNVYKALKEADVGLAENELKKKDSEKETYRTFIKELNRMIINHNIEPTKGMIIIDMVYDMQRISVHLKRVLYSIIRVNKAEQDARAETNREIDERLSSEYII
ncbi:MAG: Na/Pi cotransporter family protein [Oligoflexia bacterium]|nr:Na/Pi cotransporter family protein [Oligoflexia bacterium]